MKRKELLDKLNIAKTCLATQDIIPILTHFYFDKDKIMSFNIGQAVIIQEETGLNCCVPGDEITKLLASYNTDEISVLQKDDTVTVKSGRSNVKLKTLPAVNFPFKLESLDSAKQHDLPGEFFEGMRQVSISMGNNASKRNQYGITVVSSRTKTTLYSSDIARISSFTLSKPLESDPFTILLPRPFCENLISISKDFDGGKLYVGKEYVMIDLYKEGKTSGIQLHSKFSDDVALLPFEKIMSSLDLTKIKFQNIPESLISGIDRNLILIASDKNPEIELSTNGKIMTLTSSNAQGDAFDEIEFEETLPTVTCKMKPAFARQAIAASKKITFTDFEGGIILIGVSENFLHLVSSIGS